VGSGKETNVDHEVVDSMKNMLVDLKVDVDKLRVETPRPGLLGQGASGESLKTQLDLASERITSSLSQLSDALIKFYDGTDRAAKAITGADDDAGDWGKAMAKVEAELEAIGPDAPRDAAFICTLALGWPDGHVDCFTGRAPGHGRDDPAAAAGRLDRGDVQFQQPPAHQVLQVRVSHAPRLDPRATCGIR
jgi:hypothetical protein